MVEIGEYSEGEGIRFIKGAVVLEVTMRASELGDASFSPEDIEGNITTESVREVIEAITPRIFNVLRAKVGEFLRRRAEMGQEDEIQQITLLEEGVRRNITSIRDKTIDLVKQSVETAREETIADIGSTETDPLIRIIKSELVAMITALIRDMAVENINKEADELLGELKQDAIKCR